jgi:hypothetical protein
MAAIKKISQDKSPVCRQRGKRAWKYLPEEGRRLMAEAGFEI